MILLQIPVVPRGKGSVRGGKNFYKDGATREYMNLVSEFMRKQYQGPLLVDPLELKLSFIFPTTREDRENKYMYHKPDLDNLEKAIKDCATGIIWKDDCLVAKKTSEKLWSMGVQGIFLEVKLISD